MTFRSYRENIKKTDFFVFGAQTNTWQGFGPI